MKNQNTINRFLSKIEKKSGCHLWTSTIHKSGFGMFTLDGRLQQAHRVAFSLFVEDPAENWVLHKCGNNSCVNPNHLFLRNKKKSESEILALWEKGLSKKEISDSTGLSLSTIYRYLRKSDI